MLCKVLCDAVITNDVDVFYINYEYSYLEINTPYVNVDKKETLVEKSSNPELGKVLLIYRKNCEPEVLLIYSSLINRYINKSDYCDTKYNSFLNEYISKSNYNNTNRPLSYNRVFYNQRV